MTDNSSSSRSPVPTNADQSPEFKRKYKEGLAEIERLMQLVRQLNAKLLAVGALSNEEASW